MEPGLPAEDRDDDDKSLVSTQPKHAPSCCGSPENTDQKNSLKFENHHCQIGVVVLQEQRCPLIHAHMFHDPGLIGDDPALARKRQKTGMCENEMMASEKTTKTIVARDKPDTMVEGSLPVAAEEAAEEAAGNSDQPVLVADGEAAREAEVVRPS